LAVLAASFCGVVSTAACAQAPAAPAPAAPPATPRMADGKVDLNGIWGGGVAQLTPTACQKKVDAFANDGDPRFTAGGAKGGAQWITFEQDCGIQHRGRTSKPQYKPQYWSRIRDNDYYANWGTKDGIDRMINADPEWTNFPVGLPRIGAPNQIVQTANQIVFLYEARNQFRTVAIDCRPHDPVLKYDQSVFGLGVGCWEGNDKLVVTSMGFTDRTWLDWPGYSHSNEMVVIETFQRTGNTLRYDVEVQDPVMFLEPWKPANIGANVLQAVADPKTMLMQDVPYEDRSLGALTDGNYRG